MELALNGFQELNEEVFMIDGGADLSKAVDGIAFGVGIALCVNAIPVGVGVSVIASPAIGVPAGLALAGAGIEMASSAYKRLKK